MKVAIFKYLDFKELSILTAVSKSIRDIIVNHFLINKMVVNQMFNQIDYQDPTDNYLERATDFGLLIKRSTFVYLNKNRVKMIINIFKLVDLRVKLRTIYAKDKNEFKNFVKLIGNIFGKVISGWKFKEVLILIDEMELYFDHRQLITNFLVNEFGTIRSDEQYLRYFYRKILFESFEDNVSRGKWLIYFLNYHTSITSNDNKKTTFQARLVLLLFSPIFQEENSDIIYIDWFSYSNTIFIKEGLEYLGFALKLLNSLRSDSKPNIIIMFRTITNIALFWLPENCASLLFQAGFDVTIQVIDYHIAKSDYLHLVKYLTNLFVVETKLNDLGKINNYDKISGRVFGYLKNKLDPNEYDSILNLITTEFLTYSQILDTIPEDRDYLEFNELLRGLVSFYDVTRPKKYLVFPTKNFDDKLEITADEEICSDDSI